MQLNRTQPHKALLSKGIRFLLVKWVQLSWTRAGVCQLGQADRLQERRKNSWDGVKDSREQAMQEGEGAEEQRRGLTDNLSQKAREGGDGGCYLPALSETKNKWRSSRRSTAETWMQDGNKSLAKEKKGISKRGKVHYQKDKEIPTAKTRGGWEPRLTNQEKPWEKEWGYPSCSDTAIGIPRPYVQWRWKSREFPGCIWPDLRTLGTASYKDKSSQTGWCWS